MRKILLFCFILITLFSCQNQSGEIKTERDVNIIYTNWSEGLATTYLVKNVLEEKLGYHVTMKLDDIENIYEQVASSEYDIFLDAWLPTTHQEYFAPHKDKIVKASVLYDNAVVGLVVPDYSDFQSIEDLSSYNGKIIGIDSTAGIVKNTSKAIDIYELNTSLDPGTENTMLEELDEQYKRRNDFVITGWKPHKMFEKRDLRFLKDPKNVYGDAEKLYAIANKSHLENDPVLKEFMSRVSFTDRQISQLIQLVIESAPDYDAGAKEWISRNRLIVGRWTKNLSEFEEKAL